jgi:hypothetical protein
VHVVAKAALKFAARCRDVLSNSDLPVEGGKSTSRPTAFTGDSASQLVQTFPKWTRIMNKYLVESGWKAVLQQAKDKVKDNGLQRALASYGKLPAEKYSERQTSLQLITKLADALNNPKGHFGIKPVADYLSSISAAAAKEAQDLGKEQKASAANSDLGPVASVKTPYGGFAYFTSDKANKGMIEHLQKAIDKLTEARQDFSGMKAAAQEAEKIKKTIPNVREIIASLKKADRISADEAKQAKAAYLIFDAFAEKVVEVQEDAKNAALAASAAVKEFKADDLEERAKKLREEAERAKSAIEKIFAAAGTALKLTMAIASPDPLSKLELASTAFETLESMTKIFGNGTGGLIEQAEENERTAHDLKLDAVEERMKQTRQHLENLQKRQESAIRLYGKARVLIAMTGKAPMKGFDANTKGKFQFKTLEDYADRLAEVCDLGRDVIEEAKLVYDISDVLQAPAASGKWKLPQPDSSKKVLQQMKDEAVKLGKEAGVAFHAASPARTAAQALYAEAQEALANSNA